MAMEKSKKGRELINPAYWIGHSFTVLATIVGVYLAASAATELK